MTFSVIKSSLITCKTNIIVDVSAKLIARLPRLTLASLSCYKYCKLKSRALRDASLLSPSSPPQPQKPQPLFHFLLKESLIIVIDLSVVIFCSICLPEVNTRIAMWIALFTDHTVISFCGVHVHPRVRFSLGLLKSSLSCLCTTASQCKK